MTQSIVMKNSSWKKFFLPAVMILGLLSSSLTSCNSDVEDSDPLVFNLVTLKSVSTTGGMTFTYRTGETTPLLTLTTPLTFSTEYGIKTGDRVVIGYTVPEGRPSDEGGPINLLNFRLVYNDTVKTATQEVINSWMAAQVNNTQVWRTGNYINAYSLIPVVTPNVYMQLFADPASINNGSMDLYLTLSNISTSPTQQGECYSSYNLGNFFVKYPDVHTLKVHVAGAYGGSSEVIFKDVHYLPGE